jgi:hypothetical protein
MAGDPIPLQFLSLPPASRLTDVVTEDSSGPASVHGLEISFCHSDPPFVALLPATASRRPPERAAEGVCLLSQRTILAPPYFADKAAHRGASISICWLWDQRAGVDEGQQTDLSKHRITSASFELLENRLVVPDPDF